jgi:hypothetical protein
LALTGGRQAADLSPTDIIINLSRPKQRPQSIDHEIDQSSQGTCSAENAAGNAEVEKYHRCRVQILSYGKP